MATVKSAISIEERLFAEVNELARKLNVSRSRLIGMAAQDFIQRHRNKEIIQAINEAYDDGMEAETEIVNKMRPHHRHRVKDEW